MFGKLRQPFRRNKATASDAGDIDPTTNNNEKPTDGANAPDSFDGNDYTLKKKRPGCTGMFWRPDPSGKEKLQSGDNWPRDGAILRGVPVEAKGRTWLRVTAIMQPRSSQFKKAPEGAFMPFEYDNHYYLDQVQKK